MNTCLNLLISGGLIPIALLNGLFPFRLHLQKDAKLLGQSERIWLATKINGLAKRLEIKKPVEIIEIKGLFGSAQALGMAALSGRIGIAIEPNILKENSPDELEFIIAHELSHIKANDNLYFGIVAGTVGVITTLAMSILFPSSAAYFSSPFLTGMFISPAAAVGFAASFVALIFFSRWREECADKLAFSVCSDAAKKAAPQCFEKTRVDQLNWRDKENGSLFSKLMRKCLISEEGNFHLDILHPALTTRISYLTT